MNGYIDMHCDTLSKAMQYPKNSITTLEGSHIDIDRMRHSDLMAQCFALFLPQNNDPSWFGKTTLPSLQELMDEMYQIFLNTLKENEDCLRFACSYDDLLTNSAEGFMSAILTIENSAIVEGKMENIKKCYDMGVRLMSLTWNDPNCFGHHHSSDPELMKLGLTDFGKEAIEYMNELGIVIDVSHLNDGGFYDVASITKKPFVASHSNCRALSPATRNLTDDMIRALAEKGGCAGLNLAPPFLTPDSSMGIATIELMCNHIEYLYKVGGEDSIAIGTDFDGIQGDLEIDSCDKMYLLFDALKKRGMTERVLDKLKNGNVLRIFREQ